MVGLEAWEQIHFRFYNDDGSESANTANGNEDTNITLHCNTNISTVLRIKFYDTAAAGTAGAAFQLQCSKNSGTYADVTTSSSNVIAFNSSNLTDAGATTERLTAVGGGFSAGQVSEDGLVDTLAVTTNFGTECLFPITVVANDVTNSDTLDFRLLYNGVAFNSYTVTPRINVTKDAPGGGVSRKVKACVGSMVF